MIKIVLTGKQKKEIEKIHIDTLFDGKNRPKSLVSALKEPSIKSTLQSCKSLYDFIYDQFGQIRYANVKLLLVGNRQQMQTIISKIGKIINKNYSDKLLKDIFVYEKFKNWKCSKDILQTINVNVCPYCNRQYTFTLKKEKVRPQFDHYFPKSIYPYLALSLYNLIPSCSVCNQAKSDLDTIIEPILYPYDEDFGYIVNFETNVKGADIKYLIGLSENFELLINSSNSVQQKSIDTFHLKALYDKHKDYIVNIFKLRYIYSDVYLNNIFHALPELFRNEDDIISTLFVTQINKNDWGKRPLSKLTFDICKELGLISPK